MSLRKGVKERLQLGSRANLPFPGACGVAFHTLQRCSCKSGWQPLCVFHALLNLSLKLRDAKMWNPEAPLFPEVGGGTPSKSAVAGLARAAAAVLNKDNLEEWGPLALNRWAEHTFRVAGAQMFSGVGVELPLIQLIGRWGSQAVATYVQESALEDPLRPALAVKPMGVWPLWHFYPRTPCCYHGSPLKARP